MSLSTLLITAGALLALVIVVLAVVVLRDPGAAQRWDESIFRRPERPAKIAGEEQYYRPYWSR
jgi:hypothetical protein